MADIAGTNCVEKTGHYSITVKEMTDKLKRAQTPHSLVINN